MLLSQHGGQSSGLGLSSQGSMCGLVSSLHRGESSGPGLSAQGGIVVCSPANTENLLGLVCLPRAVCFLANTENFLGLVCLPSAVCFLANIDKTFLDLACGRYVQFVLKPNPEENLLNRVCELREVCVVCSSGRFRRGC